jgi:TetR/AcrR family transcriptional regulator, regulator of cefoperazone and chloramphenicol sensitivity
MCSGDPGGTLCPRSESRSVTEGHLFVTELEFLAACVTDDCDPSDLVGWSARGLLDQAVHLFNNLNMNSVRGDQTAAAAIRIAAMQLFAERGYAGVTVRQIASAAEVSPALVIHHYGSKEKLRAVLEERVAAFVESMLAELARAPEQGGSASVAGLFADRLEREPAMAGYVRRLLIDAGPAGVALYERLFEVTRAGLQALEQAGVVRPAQDEPVRSAFLLSNDLAMLLLRPHISEVAGVDPLARDGLARWAAAAFDVYVNGLFAPAPSPAQATDTPAKGDR